MEAVMKRFLHVLLFCISLIHAQEYTITFFGFPAVDVKMNIDSNKIDFTAKTVGFIDLIWPTSNLYSVEYDLNHYGILSFEKNIQQGTTKYSSIAHYSSSDSILNYDKQALKRIPEIQSIFTLLVQVQKEPVDALDTKWFSMDHDGKLYSARFLWADTSTISLADSGILCDHYRLDIKAEEDVTSVPEQSDYFMDNIIESEAIRQLWVENSGQRRIIQAAVKVFGINIIARIKHV